MAFQLPLLTEAFPTLFTSEGFILCAKTIKHFIEHKAVEYIQLFEHELLFWKCTVIITMFGVGKVFYLVLINLTHPC